MGDNDGDLEAEFEDKPNKSSEKSKSQKDDAPSD